VVRAPSWFTAAELPELAADLLRRHPVFRAGLVTDADGRWRHLRVEQWIDPAAIVRDVDATCLDDNELRELVRQETIAVRDELDARPGGMLRLVRLDRGPGRPGRLLVVAHNLAVDGVSWRILAEDIAAFGAAAPAPEGTSFAAWARRLADHGASPQLAAEAELWQRIATGTGTITALPVCRPRDASDVHGRLRRTRVSCPAELGRALLVELPQRFGTGIDAVLLAALGVALSALGPDGDVLVDLENHGRVEDIDPALHLSRTVGLFTAIAPVPVDTRAGSDDAASRIPRAAAALAAIPRGGIGYGLLRHPPAGAPRVAASGAEVALNYVGRITGRITAARGAPDDDWAAAPESEDVQVGFAPEVRVGHSLAVDALARDTVLEATFSWPAGVLDDAAVQTVADRWAATLTRWARA
jgi:non-ribosomal peptide synthase protein (TIGR01720 family)